MENLTLPRQLAESALESMIELRGERSWWKDEPRGNYQKIYWQLCKDIWELETCLGQRTVNNLSQEEEK